MSKQLLVNNDSTFLNGVATASGGSGGETIANPTDVPEARVVAFNADDFSAGILDLGAAAPAGVENVIFVQGAGPEDDPIMSHVVKVADIKDLTEAAYEAPIAQTSTVTPVAGEGFAYVRVVRADAGFKPHERITVESKIDNKTLAEIAEDLANKINKARPNFVSAEAVGNDLVITGELGVSFETQTDEAAEDWAIVGTAPNFGRGTSDQLRNIEEVAYGGNFTNRIYLPVPPPSYVENLNYDVSVVRVPTNTTPNISSANAFKDLYIAGENEVTNIDLATFFGV